MELVSEAIAFAVKAHDGMRRKKEAAPYILHPMEAAVIVGSMSNDQNLIAAAALHDVVEDAGITIEEIEAKFVVNAAGNQSINQGYKVDLTAFCKKILHGVKNFAVFI